MPERTSPTRAGRRYLVRFAAAMVAYGVLLPVTLVLLPRLAGNPLRYALVLVPVVPFAFLGWAVWRQIVETDELQRRIQLEALALAFAVGSVLTFGFGMLQVAGLHRASWLFVWPVYGLCWLLATCWVKRRYR